MTPLSEQMRDAFLRELQSAADNLMRHASELQVQSERFFAEAKRLREEIARLRRLNS